MKTATIVLLAAGELLTLTVMTPAKWPTKSNPARVYQGVVVAVHDGDTVTFEIRQRINVRLLDCWAPELRAKDPAARRLAIQAKNKMLEMSLNKPGQLEVPMSDNASRSFSFGRVLGHVWIDGDGKSVSQRMVESGLATRRKAKK